MLHFNTGKDKVYKRDKLTSKKGFEPGFQKNNKQIMNFETNRNNDYYLF